ncbi:MAG: hypothetical protein Unbinned2365contig1001_31 [Prokaryotic dsDNA virus sp.]|nr:MAG: hypothetical protein Unbinned2365contig1001_31 [Prokaryotic dsDNA virus sp.]|tara:strand:- start:77 stop:475 length:399 start_codon:yes stop_codon:yes gene_type:complete
MTEKEKVEKSIIYLNNKYDWNLYSLDDQFSYWDAQSANMIVEFKFRNTYYQDKYLQVDKFYNLLMAADYYDKMLYYIVIDDYVTIFNLRTLKDKIINSKVITQLAPYQTDFNKTKKVNKYFYILKHDQQTIL